MSIRKRLDGIQRIPKEYRCIAPPAPKSVKIELSPRCNYHCMYCGYSFRKDKRLDMDFELFQRITKEMKEIGVEEIGVFYIGESFINPELLVKAIRYLKQELEVPYVFLTSNASLANPEVVEKCMAVGLNSLKWSCNAANDKQFNEMMGISPRMFEIAKKNIKSAWEIREQGCYKTELYASSILYDNAQRMLMAGVLNHILPYVDDHYWLPLYTMGGVAKDAERKLGLIPVPGNPGRVDSPVEPIPCWTIFTAGHVLSDGRLTACCMDATGSWVMGDLKTQSFMEAWNSDGFKQLRQAHLDREIVGTKCEQCALMGA